MKPCLLLLLLSFSAQSQPPEKAPALSESASPAATGRHRGEIEKRFTVAVAPLWLVVQVLDLRVDYRLGSWWGVAASGAWGDPKIPYSNTLERTRYGGELRIYPRVIWLPLDALDGNAYLGTAGYWEQTLDFREGEIDYGILSPVVGYKFVAGNGFTIDYQIAVYVVVYASSYALIRDDRVTRAGRIYLGWSF